ncbi:MAG: hypothetical protein WDN69_31645 [Aliidongia sp.]
MPAADVGTGNSVIAPAVSMRAIWFADFSLNHKAPSVPRTSVVAPAFAVGMANVVTKSPAVVMTPIWLAVPSVNHRLPS